MMWASKTFCSVKFVSTVTLNAHIAGVASTVNVFLLENMVNSLEIMLNLADAGLNCPKVIEA